MHIDPLRGYNGLPYAEGGVVLFPVDLIQVEKKCEWVIACSLHALTSIHERLFHSFGTYVNRLATTASSTRVHRES
jgi:hypothetical protein